MMYYFTKKEGILYGWKTSVKSDVMLIWKV